VSDLNFILWAIPTVAFVMAFVVLAWQFRRTVSNNLKQTAAEAVSGVPAAGALLPAASPTHHAEELPDLVSRWSDSPVAAVQNLDLISRMNFARICAKFGIREISVLPSASHARGRVKTNLGILVEFEDVARVDHSVVFRLRQELFTVLGCPVDLVCKNNAERAGGQEVLAQARVVYAV
jgi:predicted nucleotidyltransferase